MKVLFVTPSEVSSGEAITALHIAENVIAEGGSVRFLASAFAGSFLREPLPESVTDFTQDAEQNRRIWDNSLLSFRPEVVVFADYPLLFFSSGASRLETDEWVKSLENLDAAIVTLDHLGYAQKPMSIFFGPPHLGFHCETTPDLPSQMQILLPCPVQGPSAITGRKGTPFRYWDLPLGLPDGERRLLRQSYLQKEQDILVLHSTPNWAWKAAAHFGLPYYSFLSKIIEYYLADLPRPITVISVNNGKLLNSSGHPNVRIINLAALPKNEYERLLFTCDLMITENGVSVSLGKAACGLRPCAVLRNSFRLTELLSKAEEPLRQLILQMEMARLGSVYPYEVFPIWQRNEIEQLGLFEQNSLTECFAAIEVFGGEATREQFYHLLTDRQTRDAMRSRQLEYVRSLESLPDADMALRNITGKLAWL
jgi:Family of unknown function (DUF6365)